MGQTYDKPNSRVNKIIYATHALSASATRLGIRGQESTARIMEITPAMRETRTIDPVNFPDSKTNFHFTKAITLNDTVAASRLDQAMRFLKEARLMGILVTLPECSSDNWCGSLHIARA